MSDVGVEAYLKHLDKTATALQAGIVKPFIGYENSNEVALPGKSYLIANRDEGGQDFKMMVNNITWKTIANEVIPEMMRTTNNYDHNILNELQEVDEVNFIDGSQPIILQCREGTGSNRSNRDGVNSPIGFFFPIQN